MKKKLSIIVLMATFLILGTVLLVFAGPTFTGNAIADFTAPDTIQIADAIGDVGLPAGAPGGTISGWDMETVFLDYDADTDIMYFGLDCGGVGGPAIICGDADGDGNPGGTSTWLAAAGGTDLANLSGNESFSILIDTDNDSNADVNIGVHDNTDITSFGTYTHQALCTGFLNPQVSFCWGAALPNTTALFANPALATPDLEFSVSDFSTLPGFSYAPGEAYSFGILVYAGSASDDGIGEDNVPNSPGTVNVPLSLMDMGDLDDPTYSTVFASNGARHIIGGPYLGACVDDDSNGQPTVLADGDDAGAANSITVGTCAVPGNDEDGVTRIVGAGNPAHGGWTNGNVSDPGGNGGALQLIITNGSGIPQVFIDFGAGLTAVTLRDNTGTLLAMPLSAGTHQVYFDIPGSTFDGINPITLQTRVRLSTAGGLAATGIAADGEVEDHIFGSGFGPTAVTLQDISATTTSTPVVFAIASLFAAALLGFSYVSYRKRQI